MTWKIPLIIALLLTSMSGVTLYYRTLYYDAEKARKIAVSDREKQQIAFEQLNRQMQTVTALDTQHTKELEHDQNLIAQLERDVADGRRRLRVKATCPNLSAYSSASRVDDATAPRLTDATQRDYFTLRARLSLAEQQITGLQEYIRQVVLRDPQAKPNP
ncbi:peptidase [Candidatus Williamhamiltonella defendens]|uniref:lysis protein n=1 Tax=Candidatus Williamhamiltonella endosymbiont of Tuberolachnus salignus TaxID=3077954 RepID=UPI0012A9F95D|nr:lysis protein [Candidatus Hamiltonella defensa]AYB48655.1 peptidase [Candidatus Hamiltonella defensa]AYB49325.1 peptidase [Candidatus Hamiltonella defensa]